MKRKKTLEFCLKNHQRKIKIDDAKIKRHIENKISLFSPPPYCIEIAIVSNKRIRALNKQFLQKNTETDVLSFKLSRDHGVIVISAETAAENGIRFGTTLENEIIYLIIHGYLHLKNYTDYSEKERTKMFKIQDRIFNEVIQNRSTEKKDEKKH